MFWFGCGTHSTEPNLQTEVGASVSESTARPRVRFPPARRQARGQRSRQETQGARTGGPAREPASAGLPTLRGAGCRLGARVGTDEGAERETTRDPGIAASRDKMTRINDSDAPPVRLPSSAAEGLARPSHPTGAPRPSSPRGPRPRRCGTPPPVLSSTARVRFPIPFNGPSARRGAGSRGPPPPT